MRLVHKNRTGQPWACPGHPRLSCGNKARTWITGTSPVMTAVVVAGYSLSWLGELTKQAIFDLAMPSHGLRAGLYPCRICGVETSEARSQVAHRERSETMCRVGARARERILTSP